MRIPASVQIGPYTYTVQREPRPLKDGAAVWGHWSNVNQLIVVDETASADRAAVTLLHESLHAIDDLLALGLEEEQVRNLAPGLYAFLRDNHLLREE